MSKGKHKWRLTKLQVFIDPAIVYLLEEMRPKVMVRNKKGRYHKPKTTSEYINMILASYTRIDQFPDIVKQAMRDHYEAVLNQRDSAKQAGSH